MFQDISFDSVLKTWSTTAVPKYRSQHIQMLIILYPILDTRISFIRPAPSRSGDPPWILKRGVLESSGQRLISSIGKTKRIASLFFGKKNIFKIFKFLEEKKRFF